MNMRTFVLKRLAFVIPQLLLVALGTFLLLRVLPIDPVAKQVGNFATEQTRAKVKEQLGLDHSLVDQAATYLGNLVKGDLGVSWDSGTAITSEIAQRFPITLQLIVLAFLLALAIAIPAGRAAAAQPGGTTDKTVSGYSLFASSQPDFWWALMFIFLLYFHAKLFPAPLGLLSPDMVAPPAKTNFLLIDAVLARDFAVFKDALWHLGLPVLTLAFVLTGPIIKMTRQSVVAVVRSEYILYARACGIPAKTVRSYMLRNALSPIVTLTGILFGYMLGGAVLIENIFSLDGLGYYALKSTLGTDFPAVQGAVVVMTAFSLLIYLAMDVLHAVLDPRVRYARN
jgi:ABC-type dipeptide/oligopeptide/nickel transport system permease component